MKLAGSLNERCQDMNILALDSSTEACSVALLTEHTAVEKFDVIGRGHAEHLLPMINELEPLSQR